MTKRKLIVISCISLSGLGILAVMLASRHQATEIAEKQAKASISEPEQKKLGSGSDVFGAWTPYTPSMNESIEAWEPGTGKVIFQVRKTGEDPRFLVAKKRAPGKKSKDARWEFPGGRVDRHETTLQATLRELQEEDPTQTLYYSFFNALKQNMNTVSFKKLELANGERHVIFKLSIEEADLEPLLQLCRTRNPLSKEIYEFDSIPIKKLNMKKKKIRKLWTSKSIKILKSLRTSAKDS